MEVQRSTPRVDLLDLRKLRLLRFYIAVTIYLRNLSLTMPYLTRIIVYTN